MENGVFVQRRGREVTERGLSLPKPKSKEGQTETLGGRRDKPVAPEDGTPLPGLLPSSWLWLARASKVLRERGDCPRGTEGQSAVTHPCHPHGAPIQTANDSKNRVIRDAAPGDSGGEKALMGATNVTDTFFIGI